MYGAPWPCRAAGWHVGSGPLPACNLGLAGPTPCTERGPRAREKNQSTSTINHNKQSISSIAIDVCEKGSSSLEVYYSN